MIGLSKIPAAKDIPSGIVFSHIMADGSKAALRNFAKSENEIGPRWTIEFVKLPNSKVRRVEIKLVINND